jgi:hypothetical protein
MRLLLVVYFSAIKMISSFYKEFVHGTMPIDLDRIHMFNEYLYCQSSIQSTDQ